MSLDLENRIANLRLHLAEQEREICLLESECNAIEEDLAEFRAQYKQLIKPLAEQIDAVKAALEKLRDLQLLQQMGENLNLESLWRKGKRRENPQNEIAPSEETDNFSQAPQAKEQRIKSLYRELARRYHPDLACDVEDRERRTRLMAMINTAYQERDFEALQALEESKSAQKSSFIDSKEPLAMLLLRRLQQQQQELAVKLRDLKEYRQDLRYGSMMELKIQASLAQARGENLLENLAKDMQQEYWAYMKELDALRQEVH